MSDRNVRMFNPTHRYDTIDEAGPIDNPTVQWSHDLDTTPHEVAVWDGQVYVTGDNGSISVFNTDGSFQWRFETDDTVTSSPAVVDSTVYVGSNDGHVYALDAASGTKRWSFQTDGEVTSSPAVVDSTVYVGSYDGHVYALDAASGTQRWSFQTDNWVYSAPTVVDGTVYIFTLEPDENVYALDAASGTQRWSFQTDGGMGSSPAVVDGTVYIGSDGEEIYALDATTGSERWCFEADERVKSSPAVVDGTVYVRSDGEEIYALDATTGSERWCFEADGRVTSPVVKNRTIYVGVEHTVCALEGAEASNNETDQTDPLTKVYQRCSNCEADLSEHDNLNFCPECGAEQ